MVLIGAPQSNGAIRTIHIKKGRKQCSRPLQYYYGGYEEFVNPLPVLDHSYHRNRPVYSARRFRYQTTNSALPPDAHYHPRNTFHSSWYSPFHQCTYIHLKAIQESPESHLRITSSACRAGDSSLIIVVPDAVVAPSSHD